MSEPDTSWWDPYSDQPYKLPSGRKPHHGLDNVREYLLIAATTLAMAPAVAWRYARPGARADRPQPESFVGLSVSPDRRYDDAIVEMVDDLGIRQLLLRVPAWDVGDIGRYVDFARRFADRGLLINILQNRDSVRDAEGWARALDAVFTHFAELTHDFQIGNAINRSKWGLAHSGEYLRLLEVAEQVRADHAGVRLLGSSVIDFEPLVTLRTLVNRHRYRLDGCAAQLYVNRRGSPFSRQYRVFDLERKLRLIYAMVSLANRCRRRLWITETNWPLLDTKPWTPNSGHPRSTVDERTQALYLKQYYQIAYRSGFVERVYWWQLINPGYGLVDHRGGRLRKHPSYQALKEIAAGALLEPPHPEG